MFILFLYYFVFIELLFIFKLNLIGCVFFWNIIVDFNSGNIDVFFNMISWVSFYNGVVVGLKIVFVFQIDLVWIVYNKFKYVELVNEYVGFFMVLGLNGYFIKLVIFNIYDYLIKGYEMISIGLLFGVFVVKLGIMDMFIIWFFSIYIFVFLFLIFIELDVFYNV